MNLIPALQAMGLLNEVQPKLKNLKKATDGFETMFVKNLLAEMQKGQKEISFGDSTGSEMYKDMMNQAIAEKVSGANSLGMGKMLYKDFAPKVVALERQQMVRDLKNGVSNLPKDKRWIVED